MDPAESPFDNAQAIPAHGMPPAAVKGPTMVHGLMPTDPSTDFGSRVVSLFFKAGFMLILLGFCIAARLPWWATVLLALGLEILAGWAIRDNLTFNLLNFLVSWPALEQWQQAWRP